jgi:hypothetical protein
MFGRSLVKILEKLDVLMKFDINLAKIYRKFVSVDKFLESLEIKVCNHFAKS